MLYSIFDLVFQLMCLRNIPYLIPAKPLYTSIHVHWTLLFLLLCFIVEPMRELEALHILGKYIPTRLQPQAPGLYPNFFHHSFNRL